MNDRGESNGSSGDLRRARPAGAGVEPESLTYDAEGLLPVVVQDAASGAVLMLAWADRTAVTATLGTGEAHFWSRSRRRLWRKGETSGNVLEVLEVRIDCDRDALLLRVRPRGPACHRGTRSCFEPNAAALELGWLAEVIAERAAGGAAAGAASSYTARLLAGGRARVAQKVGEEATEVVVAAMGDNAGRELVAESADLLYHLLVLLQASGVELGAVAAELARRHDQRALAPAVEPASEPASETGDPP